MSNDVNEGIKKDLKNYLFNLPPVYMTSAIPSEEEKIIARADRKFREIIWKLILGRSILSLCESSTKELYLILRNNDREPIEDDKLFITLLFYLLNRYYFEYQTDCYHFVLIKKLSNLPQLYDELVDIENNLARIPTYKTSRKKRGIPLEKNQHSTGDDLKKRVDTVINVLKSADFDETFWSQTKKTNEKIIRNSLYDSFKNANKSISQQDIFHFIAKVTLLFGTYKRTEALLNGEPVTPQMLLDESTRVEGIYRRFKKKISSC